MKHYDYLVVGAGLFGATFAYEAKKRGKEVLVIDRRDHIAGNIYTKEVDGINDKLKEIIYQTQKSVDEDELTFKQSIAKSKECYVLLRVVRKIAKKKDKCEKQAIDNEFAIELDKDELKLFKGLFAEMFK